MQNTRTRSNTAEGDLLHFTNPELARLERQNRREAKARKQSEMPRAIFITRNEAGDIVDAEGNRYNAEGQRLGADGLPMIEDDQQNNGGEVGFRRGAEDPDLTLADYNRPDQFYQNRSAIRTPAFERNDYELKLQYYTHVSQNPFRGSPTEYPMDHLDKFEAIVGGIKANGVPRDYFYLQLFEHSLAGEASNWLNSYPPQYFTTWEELRKEFLQYFYDDAKSEELRAKISSFKQGPKETFKAAWMRFKKFQRDCPHHGFTESQLLGAFYRGIEWRYQVSLDSASNGNFMTRNPDSAKQLIHNLTQSSGTKSIDAERAGSGGARSDEMSAVQAQLAMVVNMLKGKNAAAVNEVQADADDDVADVNWIGGNNQWGNNRNQGGYQQNNGYNRNQQQSSSIDDKIDILLAGQAKMTNDFNLKLDTQYCTLKSELDQVKIHMKKLDIQVAQTAEAVKRQNNATTREHCNAVTTRGDSQRAQGSMNNSETHDLAVDEEEVDEEIDCDDFSRVSVDTGTSVDRQRAILGDPGSQKSTLSIDKSQSVDRHIGRNFEGNLDLGMSTTNHSPVDRQDQKPKVSIDINNPVDRQECSTSRSKSNQTVNASQPELRTWKPSLPYPKANKCKKEVEEARCKEIMEALEVRIPFFEACNLAPALKKCVKRMANNTLSMEEGVVMITETCFNIIQKRMPKKLKDPGAFVLSLSIGHLAFRRSLCDLGSSVNVMPLSVAKRLGYSEFYYTPLILVLADKSTRTPKGILEDVPVKVGDCWIPVDFIVLDYEAHEPKDPIILGRPFLATAGALIDCREGTVTLRIDDKTMEFKMTKTEEHAKIDGQTFGIESLVEEDKSGGECDLSSLVQKRCDEGEDTQIKVTTEPEKPSAAPVTAVKQKAPDINRQSPKPRYKRPKPPSSPAGRTCNPPRRAHPVAVTIPTYLGRPHAQNAYTPPWMRRLSKGPRPP